MYAVNGFARHEENEHGNENKDKEHAGQVEAAGIICHDAVGDGRPRQLGDARLSHCELLLWMRFQH